ncbi:uncharacterized protein LOC108346104 isoform X2 [Vigna angularis]|uniref:uncharacterized protein LOC108345649 isoform X2 n=1 Tax=Phaseolus angularis TaxID=3914 RepID=UPI0022B2E2E9|nr:uncharacterized protein LOC108345649 isoform X2 [Vigna angularis]XP_052723473.1 uncharacterized protein LOC108346104 isoform X2 [Vigna angularis]
MDVILSSAQTKNSEDVVASPPIQIGGTGKSCHQCRQKKENFAATCKNIKKSKNCPIKYCHKCLLTRYGENAEEVAQLAYWTCPKCRGICNCSLCQKRRGEQPTGPLYHSAKESGFKSVAEMLAMKKNLETSNPLNEGNLKKEPEVFLSGELGNEYFSDANVTEVCTKDDSGENFGMNLERETIAEEILLPPGMELKEIFGIELPPKDVGNALQILEFCRVFGKALDLKEGEAEAIFKELINEEIMDEHNSSLIQFHIKLLGLIVSNSKKESPSFSTKNETNSWLKHLEDLIMQSYHLLNDFPLDWFQEGISGYYKLDLSKKFKLMTLLCDEVLNTQKLRSYIQDENSRHAKVVKETKLKIAAAKEKIKCLAQKLQNENAKVSSIPGEEHDAHIKIRTEVDEAHIEMLRLKSTDKSGCDATRINPEFVDNNGMTFWKLQSYNDESVLLLQDMKIQDETATLPEESWFVYGLPKKDEIDKYISSRAKRLKSLNSQKSL